MINIFSSFIKIYLLIKHHSPTRLTTFLQVIVENIFTCKFENF